MEFMEVLSQRYSCKKYCDKKISRQQLDAILNAGRLAPTAKNLQEHHIYVIESAEGLSKVDSVTPCRYGAQTVLLVTYNAENVFTYPESDRTSGAEDATIVATHMILAAKDAGAESCWINNFKYNEAKKVFNLAENEEILMFMDLGFAAEGAGPLPNHSSRKSLEETVSYI